MKLSILFGIFLSHLLVAKIFGAATNTNNTCTLNGVTVQVGEEFLLTGVCQKLLCFENNNIGAVGCAEVAFPPHLNCTKTVDLSKPYPDCCPQFSCKKLPAYY
uniref:Single domain-containing protein n=1 Tax=Musca domestica TaxID=7370 RepID=A0A1I8NK44_MUSDO